MKKRRLGEIPTLETRREAFDSVDRARRYKQIIEILQGGRELTAREISIEMFKRGYAPTTERNLSHPRISELLRSGVLDCVGKKKCQYSNRNVGVFKLMKNYEKNI